MGKSNLNRCCDEENFLIFTKNDYPVLQCKKCGRRFSIIPDVSSHITQVYSDEYFFGGKEGYPNYLEEKEIIINYGIRYAHIIEKYIKPGKLLDVGCAAGFVLHGFETQGWKGIGIEPNTTMANYGRSKLNLDISIGSLETYSTRNKFELITLIQVIGHFYDIDTAMKKISGFLVDNGLVLVESWNMNSLVARILGKNWHEYSPPSVINWFSGKSLTQLFKEYGFQLIDKGFPAKRINLKHALSLLEAKYPRMFFKKQLFDFLANSRGRLVIPYPPVDINWYLFRKV